jgi:hypothetical protein
MKNDGAIQTVLGLREIAHPGFGEQAVTVRDRLVSLCLVRGEIHRSARSHAQDKIAIYMDLRALRDVPRLTKTQLDTIDLHGMSTSRKLDGGRQRLEACVHDRDGLLDCAELRELGACWRGEGPNLAVELLGSRFEIAYGVKLGVKTLDSSVLSHLVEAILERALEILGIELGTLRCKNPRTGC